MSRTPEFELYAEALSAVEYGLHDVADKIAQLIKADAWRSYMTPTGRLVNHESFVKFVSADPLDGLGTDIETVKRVCRDTPYALDLVDQALQRKPGRPSQETPDNVRGLDYGNSSQGALRRLRKDRPDLHERVLAEELSTHAAMVEAGFRPRTATIRLDDPGRIAATLKRHLSPADIDAVVEHLASEMSQA